jgi:hypothetical protein
MELQIAIASSWRHINLDALGPTKILFEYQHRLIKDELGPITSKRPGRVANFEIRFLGIASAMTVSACRLHDRQLCQLDQPCFFGKPYGDANSIALAFHMRGDHHRSRRAYSTVSKPKTTSKWK